MRVAENTSGGQQPKKTDRLMPRFTDRIRTLGSRGAPRLRVWVRRRDVGPSPVSHTDETLTAMSSVLVPSTVINDAGSCQEVNARVIPGKSAHPAGEEGGAEIKSVLPAIRQPGEGFRDDEHRYRAHLASVKDMPMPADAKTLRHQIPWPIDMSDPRAHITAYHRDPKYTNPSAGKHWGIDIQAPLGTQVTAPEDLRVLLVDTDTVRDRGLGDMMLYSPTTKLVYHLGHLAADSIPERLRRQRHYPFEALGSEVFVQAGEPLGNIGMFFNDFTAQYGISQIDPTIQIPGDVEDAYGRAYDHLHVSIEYHPSFENLMTDLKNYTHKSQEVNPLFFLQRLYPNNE